MCKSNRMQSTIAYCLILLFFFYFESGNSINAVVWNQVQFCLSKIITSIYVVIYDFNFSCAHSDGRCH